MSILRIAVIDDHPIVLAGFQAALARESDLELVATHSTAGELAGRAQFDLAVVDPNGTGPGFVTQLHRTRPEAKILVLSSLDEPIRIADMLRVGASGYALKTQPIDEILEGIRIVARGGCYLPPTVSFEEVEALRGNETRPFDLLSAREREVFAYLMRGQSNDDIATALFISKRTVETHRQRILKKMQAHSIVELFRIASRYGLFDHGNLHRERPRALDQA